MPRILSWPSLSAWFVTPFLAFGFFGCVAGPGGADIVANTLAMPASATAVGKSARFVPAPLRSGQWATYLVGANTPSPLVYTIKVLEEGDLPYSFWFEEELASSETRVVARSQFLMDEARVAVANAREAESWGEAFAAVVTDYGRNVRTLVSTNGASPIEVPRSDTPPGLFILRTRAALFGGAEVSRPRQAKVRAGVFEGCFEASGTMTMEGREGPVSGCLDPQVPVHGLIEGRDPLGRRWELMAFGFAGAKSAL